MPNLILWKSFNQEFLTFLETRFGSLDERNAADFRSTPGESYSIFNCEGYAAILATGFCTSALVDQTFSLVF